MYQIVQINRLRKIFLQIKIQIKSRNARLKNYSSSSFYPSHSVLPSWNDKWYNTTRTKERKWEGSQDTQKEQLWYWAEYIFFYCKIVMKIEQWELHKELEGELQDKDYFVVIKKQEKIQYQYLERKKRRGKNAWGLRKYEQAAIKEKDRVEQGYKKKRIWNSKDIRWRRIG